nr:unnamed protein product [Callosobruchus chinensis]
MVPNLKPIFLSHLCNVLLEEFSPFSSSVLCAISAVVICHYLRGMWLQLDDALAHFARSVRDYLNANHSPWIGRGGTVAWPPR